MDAFGTVRERSAVGGGLDGGDCEEKLRDRPKKIRKEECTRPCAREVGTSERQGEERREERRTERLRGASSSVLLLVQLSLGRSFSASITLQLLGLLYALVENGSATLIGGLEQNETRGA